jgi:hypothetical protein
MAETKHTPGPWVLCVDSLDGELTIEQDRTAIDEEPAVIATVHDGGDGIDREIALVNGAFIASAPDLLKQRDMLLEALEKAALRFDKILADQDRVAKMTPTERMPHDHYILLCRDEALAAIEAAES